MTVEEFEIGQTYMLAKRAERETADGEYVKMVKDEPFDHEVYGKGQLTEKVIYLSKKIPGFIKKIFPSLKRTTTMERAYYCYPKCFTEYIVSLIYK